MKVVLCEDIKKLGQKGDVIDVAEGYARNYLIPRGLAVAASKGVLKDVNFVQDSRAKKDARQEQNAHDLAARLQDLTVTVEAKAGEGGKLYGAVTSRDVAAELEHLLSEKINRRKIELPEAIKKPGNYPILIRLHPGVQVEITLNVVAK